ncbi:DUF2069 domain-containing protein [Lysobacter sp. BMK333-48F3]|uniref:DUF2069 domain-containing protein n=1 Tax=Lysobacter sp. BMK333-48F3 TaxID=2867962 RepID=UPI001C8CB122|nr:DUF2069 domain-containing protein [Lysobacter sp. BMK333-48F3]
MNAPAPRSRAQTLLLAALLGLVALFSFWYLLPQRHLLAGLLVFVLPPALLALGVWRRSRRAGYWSGVCALAWFCHAVMLAWSSPAERGYAWIELALALLVIFAANQPGLAARFGRKAGDKTGA